MTVVVRFISETTNKGPPTNTDEIQIETALCSVAIPLTLSQTTIKTNLGFHIQIQSLSLLNYQSSQTHTKNSIFLFNPFTTVSSYLPAGTRRAETCSGVAPPRVGSTLEPAGLANWMLLWSHGLPSQNLLYRIDIRVWWKQRLSRRMRWMLRGLSAYVLYWGNRIHCLFSGMAKRFEYQVSR